VSELGFSDIGFDLWPDEFYEEEGFSDVGKTWVFNTALDERTCERCTPLEGEPFLGEDIEDYFPNAEQIDETMIRVNIHDFCRCELVLAEEYWGEEEELV
jgi:hypothetical protein